MPCPIGHRGLQGNVDADALAREEIEQYTSQSTTSNSYLTMCWEDQDKEWLTMTHSKYWHDMLDMTELKLLIQGPSEIRLGLLGLDRKHCTLVTQLLTVHCTLRKRLYVMGHS